MQSQLQKGVQKLSQLPSRCYGLNVVRLLHEVEPYIRKEYTQQAVFPEPLPKIDFETDNLSSEDNI
jgi:hypothetical protein